MSENDIVTAYDKRFEYFETVSNGYPTIEVPIWPGGLLDEVVIETWRKVFINRKPAWKRVDATEE